MSEIEYRDIPELLGYRAGSDGSIWSDRLGKGWRQRKLHKFPKGYFALVVREGGKSKTFVAHRLILSAFRGPCPDGCEARHLDGNNENNRIENLAWGTKQENFEDRSAHGTARPGAKLTEADVSAMRLRRADGESFASIGRAYGVLARTVAKAVYGKTWKTT